MSARGFVRGCLASFRSLAELSGAERRLYLDAWWALLVVQLRLRFPRLLRGRELVRQSLDDDAARGPARVRPSALVAVFQRARADHPLSASCLPRSLALLRYLRRHGAPARLGLGLRRQDGQLSGHAWITSEGHPVADSVAFVDRFRQLRRGP